ncbi:MAG TPA: FAD-binding oxidoreductase [Bryobacteraceae bacterium]|nr:FAD-binding oxidoreductase [Bryobacteraceae bacterium]
MSPSIHLRAEVISRRDVSPELWVVRLMTEEKVAFEPGQYVTIRLPDGSRSVERPYSVASSPADRELEFFVELVREGELTPQLYDVPVGGEVRLRRLAKGRFLFDRRSGHANHFMVATVTGVAPFLSMLRDFVAAQADGQSIPYRVALLHAASAPAEFGYLDELSACASRNAWFRYIPTVSRTWSEPDWPGEKGRAEDVLRKHLDAPGWTPADTTVYLCGHPDMVRNSQDILLRAGFAKDGVKVEQYWVEAAPRDQQGRSNSK